MDCKTGMMKHHQMGVMMMNNRAFVDDAIEFDQTDVVAGDGRHLTEVVENKDVENLLHSNSMKREWMERLEYLLD